MQRARFFRAVSHVVLGLILLAFAVAPQTSGNAAESQIRAPRFDVVAVLDTSLRDGQNAKNLEDQKRALTKYVRSLPPAIRVSIVTVGKFPTVIRDLTNERDATVVAVTDLSADGDAALLDGLVLAADQFETLAESKKQIVMFTDGNDQSSSSTIDLVRTRLLNDGIRIDAITFSTANANSATIDLLTGSTGGQAVAATDLKGVVDLAARTTEWARPVTVVVPTPPSPTKKLLSSPLIRYLLMGLVFIAVLMAMLSLTAPGPEKLNLTGQKSSKRGVSTPVAGLAEKMTQVADKAIAKQGRTKGINASLERAGIILRPGEFVVLAVALGTAFGAVAVLKFGLAIGAPVGIFGTLLGGKIFLARKIKKRANAFGEQLSDTLQLLSSSLRAGQSMMQALDSVSKEGDPPASEEFRRVIVEARLGRDVVDAMKAMADRVQSEDFGWVVPAIEINREVGGDLAEVLDTVAKTIRDRADLRRQVKTLSAEGRFSAFVLLGLPVAITAIIRTSNPEYISSLGQGKGLYMAGGAIALMVIGAVWLMKLCKIEF